MMLLRSKRFFTTKTVRRKVEAILHRFGLTAANIDAEALRCSLADIAEINRRLTELGSRRDKILQRIEDDRAGLARPTHLQQRGDADEPAGGDWPWRANGRSLPTVKTRSEVPDREPLPENSAHQVTLTVTG